MSSNAGPPAPDNDARDNRRWLIGVAISLAFGLFGVVMALLSYSERGTAPAAPGVRGTAAPKVAPAGEAPRNRRRDRGRD